MKIFDCHTHVGDQSKKYDLPGVAARNVIFNSIDSYKENNRRLKKGNAVSLIFEYRQAFDFVAAEIAAGRVHALKIHNRTQRIAADDYPELEKKLASLGSALPIIYDAFYYGDDLRHQPSLAHLIGLAKRFPRVDFIVAHAGGIEVLKYFFHLRTLPNIHYDLSFSLQYLHDTSCFPDLVKLIKYTDKRKIMFGSDYPWVSPAYQMKVLKGIFRKFALRKADQEDILYNNARRIFG